MAPFTENEIQAYIQQGYSISTDKTLLDLEKIYDYLINQSYWSAGLTKERFDTAISNSLCFGIFKNNETIGFARVVTDQAIFAYICDVIVDTHERGKGLGKWLIHSIINYPELSGLRRWSLVTKDAHNLYKQFSFTPLAEPEKWMEINKPFKI